MQIYLETQRLILRRFTTDDVENLVALDGDPAVMRYLTGGAPTPRAVIEHDILPEFIHAYARQPGFGVWAAQAKGSGDFLGWLSFRPPEGGNADNVAVGYRLRQAVWGQGFATEGVRALIHRGFTELGVQRVYATTYQDNLASRRVMEKVGMTLVRSYRLTQADLAASDTFAGAALDLWDGEDVEYALTKSEWERQEQMPVNA